MRIVDNFDRAMERVLDNEPAARIRLLDLWHVSDRLRMFDEASNPVRTPSHMPKATIQLAWLKNRSTEDPTNASDRFCEVRSRCG